MFNGYIDILLSRIKKIIANNSHKNPYIVVGPTIASILAKHEKDIYKENIYYSYSLGKLTFNELTYFLDRVPLFLNECPRKIFGVELIIDKNEKMFTLKENRDG